MSFFAFQPLVLNGKNIEDYTACQIVMQIGKSLRFGYTIWRPCEFQCFCVAMLSNNSSKCKVGTNVQLQYLNRKTICSQCQFDKYH